MSVWNEKFGQVSIFFDATDNGANDSVMIYKTDREEDTVLNIETSTFGVEADQIAGYIFGNHYLDIDNCTFTCYGLINKEDVPNLTSSYSINEEGILKYKPNCKNLLYGYLQIHPLCLGLLDNNDIICNNAICNITIEGNMKVDDKFNIRIEFKLNADQNINSNFYNVPFIIGDTTRLDFPLNAEIALDYNLNGLYNFDGSKPVGFDTLEENEDGTFKNADGDLQGQIVDNQYLWAGLGTENIGNSYTSSSALNDKYIVDTSQANDLIRWDIIENAESTDGRCRFGSIGASLPIGSIVVLSGRLRGSNITGITKGSSNIDEIESFYDMATGEFYYKCETNAENSLIQIDVTLNKPYVVGDFLKLFNLQVEKNPIVTPYVDDTRENQISKYLSDFRIEKVEYSLIFKFEGKVLITEGTVEPYVLISYNPNGIDNSRTIQVSNTNIENFNDLLEEGLNTIIINKSNGAIKKYVNGIETTLITVGATGTIVNSGEIYFNSRVGSSGTNQGRPNNKQYQNILLDTSLSYQEIEYYSQNRLVDIPSHVIELPQAEIALDYTNNNIIGYNNIEGEFFPPLFFSNTEFAEDGTFKNISGTVQGQITDKGIWAGTGTENLQEQNGNFNTSTVYLGNNIYETTITDITDPLVGFRPNIIIDEEYYSIRFEYISSENINNIENISIRTETQSFGDTLSITGFPNDIIQTRKTVIGAEGSLGTSFCRLRLSNTGYDIGSKITYRVTIEQSEISTPYVDDTREHYKISYENKNDFNLENDEFYCIQKFYDDIKIIDGLYNFNIVMPLVEGSNRAEINIELADQINEYLTNNINTLIVQSQKNSNVVETYINGIKCENRNKNIGNRGNININVNDTKQYSPQNNQIQNILSTKKGTLTEDQIEEYSQPLLFDVPKISDRTLVVGSTGTDQSFGLEENLYGMMYKNKLDGKKIIRFRTGSADGTTIYFRLEDFSVEYQKIIITDNNTGITSELLPLTDQYTASGTHIATLLHNNRNAVLDLTIEGIL